MGKETINVTTGRPDEYKGTIALDHHSAGGDFSSYMEGLVSDYIGQGYAFVGFDVRLYVEGLRAADCDIDIILEKAAQGENSEFVKVTRSVPLIDFLYHTSMISIRLEKSEVDWDKVTRLEE